MSMMIKRMLAVLMCIVFAAGFAGCGSEGEAETETEPSQEYTADAVDVDLTEMSSVMVYSEVNDIVLYPDEYDGKIVRMKGLFAKYENEEIPETIYACIVQDATACCANGLEFKLADGYDYPEEGEEITITGEMKALEYEGLPYCVVENAVLE